VGDVLRGVSATIRSRGWPVTRLTSSTSMENHLTAFRACWKMLRKKSARPASNRAKISCEDFCGWNLYSE
jgi:hypothetical protein